MFQLDLFVIFYFLFTIVKYLKCFNHEGVGFQVLLIKGYFVKLCLWLYSAYVVLLKLFTGGNITLHNIHTLCGSSLCPVMYTMHNYNDNLILIDVCMSTVRGNTLQK